MANQVALPRYTYDPATGRYYYAVGGQPVAERRVKEVREGQVSEAEAALALLALLFFEGKIAPAVWVAQMDTKLLRLHLILAAVGAGGWEQLTEEDVARVERRLSDDRPRVAGTATDVVAGAITVAVLLARVNVYIGGARTQYYDARRPRLQRSASNMMLLERRILGNSRHCPDCLRYYGMGWQPAGTLPSPGMDSVCGGACRCDFMYVEVPAVEAHSWIGTRR